MIQARAVPRTALALMFALVGCGDSPALFSSDDPTNDPTIATTLPGASVTAGTITLITGDRVTVQSVAPSAHGGVPVHGAPRVTAGPGRSKIPVTITQRNGEFTVMPQAQDMAALVASGQLDPQLFNVTRLIADGFGDDKRGDLPLVVTDARDAAALRQASVTLGRTLPTPHAVAVRQDKGSPSPLLASLVAPMTVKASDARSAPMTRIWLDRPDQPDQRAAQVQQGAGRRDVGDDAAAFDLTLSVLDTSGHDGGGSLFLVGIDPGTDFVDDFISGTTTFHLGAGHYMVWTLDAVGSANMVAPRFLLSGDSTLVMDGRLSKPVDVEVAGQDLALSQVSWAFTDSVARARHLHRQRDDAGGPGRRGRTSRRGQQRGDRAAGSHRRADLAERRVHGGAVRGQPVLHRREGAAARARLRDGARAPRRRGGDDVHQERRRDSAGQLVAQLRRRVVHRSVQRDRALLRPRLSMDHVARTDRRLLLDRRARPDRRLSCRPDHDRAVESRAAIARVLRRSRGAVRRPRRAAARR